MQTPSFIFGGDTGVSNPQELAKRREIVDALIASSLSRAPQTFGEGLTAIGQAIAGRIKDKKLKGEEQSAREAAQGQFSAITGQLMGGQPMGGGGYGMPAKPLDPRDPTAIAGDTMRALGKDKGTEGYRASLVGTESGGNWKAQNNEVGAGGARGHFGRVQFGQARLQEAMAAGAIPQGTTPEQFMQSPALQIAAENWHFKDLEGKLAPYVGRVVNGQPMDMGALVAMGHLGGAEGARKFVESGGAYNPADAYGTNLSEYAATHGGANPQLAAQLGDLASNPYASQGQQTIAQQLMQQQLARMQPQDPMKDIELQKAQMELQQMQQPQAPKPVEVGGRLVDPATGKVIYEPPATGGADDPYAEREAAAARMGLAQDDPAYQSFVLTGRMPREDQAPLTATDKNAILQADEMVLSNTATIDMLNQVLAPDESGTSLNDRAGYGATAGLQSFAARNDPTGMFDDAQGQATTELQNLVLNQALGQLKSTFGAAPTEGERKILIDLQASIDKTPAERKSIIERAVTAAQKRLEFNQQKAAELRGGTYYKPQGGKESGGVPDGVDPELWGEMTPEERAVFQ